MENQSSSPSARSRSPKVAAFNIPPLDTTLIRYLHSRSSSTSPVIGTGFGSPVQSRSPLASIENFYTPPSRSPPAFKMEEDVFVMDGILVGDVTRGKARSRSFSSSGGRARLSLGSESVGSSSPSSGSVSWQSDGSARLKVAHGKKEPHPSRFGNKEKSELQAKICKFTSSGSCSHGAKCPFLHHHASESESPISLVANGKEELHKNKISEAKICTFTSPGYCSHGADCLSLHHHASESGSPTYVTAVETPKLPKASTKKLQSSTESCSSINSITLKSADWCPLDDGIDSPLPSKGSTGETSTREDVSAYIDRLLYGPSRGKRLAVFAEICSK